MPGLSKVIVLDPDVRSGRQVQLGFEREGLAVAAVPADPATLDLPGEDTGLVVVGGARDDGLALVRAARAVLERRRIDALIVFAGSGVERGAAEAAGADEVVLHPAYLRDVVTIGRLLCGVPATHRRHLVGNLIEVTGVFTLVRAFAALGRSATLTLIRGLRRGEIRFYHGEVTSAQVGMIHGQAALHQLLLWTDARFDFHHEDVVRRQQIPLSHDELFADAERFLEGVRDSSGGLSPSIVLEQDLPRVQSFGRQIPTEVYGVLRMFDGHRVLADVLEDSAYRVFETLRVAQRAVEIGLLRVIDKQPVRASWRTILALEEWLVGTESRDAPVDSGAVAAPGARDTRNKSRKRRKKKKRTDTPVAVAVPVAAKDIDWGALVPRIVGAEVGPLAGVVPAAQASGEIHRVAGAPRDEAPHRVEPKVVFDEAAERARNAAEIAARAATIRAEQARVEAEAQARVDAAQATAAAEADRVEREAAAVTEAARVEREAAAATEAARVSREAAAATEAARVEREAAAATEAARVEREAAAATEAARVEREAVTAEAARVEREAAAATEAARVEREAAAAEATRVEREAVAAEAARVEREAVAAEAARVEREAVAAEAARVEREAVAAEAARVEREAAASEAARLERDAAAAEAGRVERDTTEAETARIERDASEAETARVTRAAADDARPERGGNRTTLQGIAVAAAAVVDAPTVDISGAITARTTVPSAAVADVSGAVTAKIAVVPPPAASPLVAAPGVIIDEPSDGVIVQHIATAKTAPVQRRRLPSDPPEDDRPVDTMGEITSPHARSTAEPRHSEPSILVADLAAVHTAVSAIASAQAAAPPTADATSASHEAPVIAARRDVAAFSEVEEAFFRAGHEKEAVVAAPPVESFEDLDEGYRPVGFWSRLRGRSARRPVTLDSSPARPAPRAPSPAPAQSPATTKPSVPAKSPVPTKSPALARSPAPARSPTANKKKPKKR